jgi:hypothetical protein
MRAARSLKSAAGGVRDAVWSIGIWQERRLFRVGLCCSPQAMPSPCFAYRKNDCHGFKTSSSWDRSSRPSASDTSTRKSVIVRRAPHGRLRGTSSPRPFDDMLPVESRRLRARRATSPPPGLWPGSSSHPVRMSRKTARRTRILRDIRSTSSAVRTARLEAVAAIDRFVAARLERHFGRLSALAAGRLEHLAWATRAASVRVASVRTAAAGTTLCLARGSAVGAAIGLVLEALRGEELLFACREAKGVPAINAGQGFVRIQNEAPGVSSDFDSLRT